MFRYGSSLVGYILLIALHFCNLNGQDARLIVDMGHTDRINVLAFNKSGFLLASGSDDGAVRIYQVSSGKELRTLVGHTGRVYALGFQPGLDTLASGSDDGTVKVWDPATGSVKWSRVAHPGGIRAIKFDPTGKVLVSAGVGGKVLVWSADSGEPHGELVHGRAAVSSVDFSPNGGLIATGSYDHTIKIWKASDLSLVRTIEVTGHSTYVKDVRFLHGGRSVLSISWDYSIREWSVETGAELRRTDQTFGQINSIDISPDGNYVAVGRSRYPDQQVLEPGSVPGNTVSILKISDGSDAVPLEHDQADVNAVRFSPDGKLLAGALGNNMIRIWSAGSGEIISSRGDLASGIGSLSFSRDEKFLAVASGDKSVNVWDLSEGALRRNLRARTIWPFQISFGPDNSTVAAGSDDGFVEFWNAQSGLSSRTKVLDEYEKVRPVAFSKDGSLIAGGSFSQILVWDAKDGTLRFILAGHSGWVGTLAFSSDGETLASGGADGTVKLWNLASRELVRSIDGNASWVNALSFSPDGRLIASAGEDHSIRVWSVDGTQKMFLLDAHNGPVKSLAFSPDGRTIVSGGSDNTVRGFGSLSGSRGFVLSGHSSVVNAVAVHPNGGVLASGSGDGTVKFWNATTHVELCTLVRLKNGDWVVATPDGRFDTNKDLDRIDGLHWVISDEPFSPKPLEIFMRQYYEPGLLSRVLKCNEENTCGREFKPLPPITQINRVQPTLSRLQISTSKIDGTLDITIEVRNLTEEVRGGEKRSVSSGIYDLRLFRNGQLVGISAPRQSITNYLKAAPRLIEESRKANAAGNTPEDKAWRAANDITKVAQVDADGKVTFTFRNIPLPGDGRPEVEFSAYAFNSDRVKSGTVRHVYEVPKPETKKGKTYLVTIGVNASENPRYTLNYAVNDAEKMQSILGERLRSSGHELVQINLTSSYGPNGELTENLATKTVIKAVFDLLAGHRDEVARGVLDRLEKIPRFEAVHPEDTLIITFSGHGYVDNYGIFYLLPYDIGASTEKLTADVRSRLISSDELSLWMLDIAAQEMILIVDACHSAAAVQGDGFKPGPMGSRGLGQLAYDKRIRVLAATQSDNVALELAKLKQGLLSYALLEDGINLAKADVSSPKDNNLTSKEWLSYAVRGVPQIYEDVIAGRRNVIIRDAALDFLTLNASARAEAFCFGNQCRKAKMSVQQPALFDFVKQDSERILMSLK